MSRQVSAYLDLTCGDFGVMGQQLLAANVSIIRHCVSAPRELCSTTTEFYDFVTNLTHFDTLAQLPAAWQSVFQPLVGIFQNYDAVEIVRGCALTRAHLLLYCIRSMQPLPK